MADCAHIESINDSAPGDDGCHECLQSGSSWVHLRMCRNCGHVGCCDSSPNRHASKHAESESHPVISSFEPGENWFYCYVDDVAFELSDVAVPSHS